MAESGGSPYPLKAVDGKNRWIDVGLLCSAVLNGCSRPEAVVGMPQAVSSRAHENITQQFRARLSTGFLSER